MKLKPGTKLKNGATVLQYAADKRRPDTGYVIAMTTASKHSDEIEYVTWAVNEGGGTFWGHYFQGDLVGAVRDFQKRYKGE